ncbi:MAG: response regulator transcription factor [Caldilineaceae bacterium]|nr:response regulator transcription factor [Caldilineaceae bacterium]
MSSQPPIRLLVVESNEFVRFGLASFLGQDAEWDLVGIVSTVSACIELCQAEQPDVILLDMTAVNHAAVSPQNAIEQIRSLVPKARVVFWSDVETLESVAAVLIASADGYLGKDIGQADLLIFLQQIARGRAIMCSRLSFSSILPYIAEDTSSAPTPPITLTRREWQVLRLLSQGRSNSEIAEDLKIQISTASVHVSNIITKLEADNRTHAVLRAAELGLTELPNGFAEG